MRNLYDHIICLRWGDLQLGKPQFLRASECDGCCLQFVSPEYQFRRCASVKTQRLASCHNCKVKLTLLCVNLIGQLISQSFFALRQLVTNGLRGAKIRISEKPASVQSAAISAADRVLPVRIAMV